MPHRLPKQLPLWRAHRSPLRSLWERLPERARSEVISLYSHLIHAASQTHGSDSRKESGDDRPLR